MTDYGHLLLIACLLPVVGFMIGTLWADAGHQLREESEEDDNVPVGNSVYARNRFGLRDDI